MGEHTERSRSLGRPHGLISREHRGGSVFGRLYYLNPKFASRIFFMSLPSDSPDNSSHDALFRWQALFHKTTEPLFLLNRQRRLLFVNRAWEALTGLTLVEVKGQVCRRRPRGILAERVEIILGAMAPPPEVDRGQPAQ